LLLSQVLLLLLTLFTVYVTTNAALQLSLLLQGLALSSLLDLLRALVQANAKGLAFPDLLAALRNAAKGAASTASGTSLGGGPLARQTVGNVARCVAATCAPATEAQR
jgi:hypothetical protein